jgi:Ca-activated chloride channel family protein
MNARISVLATSALVAATLAACSYKEAPESYDIDEAQTFTPAEGREVDAPAKTASSTRSIAQPVAQPAPVPAVTSEPVPELDMEMPVEEEIAMVDDAGEDYDAAEASAPQAVATRSSRERSQNLAKKAESKDVGGAVSGASAAMVIGGALGAGAMPSAPPADVMLDLPDVATSNTESYTDYGVNDLTLTEKDRYSTFSIDVDTASYTISRRKLQSGQLPPTASVRVEEFVNYFPYEYTPPTGDAPFSVNMEAAPNPFQPGHHVMRVGVQGQLPDLESREPVHLTFLVDTSGSMSSRDKLGLAQKSLHELVENLEPGDTVALGTYAGSVSKVLGPTDVSRGASKIHDAIDALSAGGGTGMSSGVELAYQMASEAMVQGHENRVIVLSDGDANIGPTSHEEILRTIKRYAEEGITLSTIGLGMGNYKDTMMEQLANQGDGNYFYIDSQKEAKKVFGEDLSGTLQVIAKDVKIQVEFNPDAVMGYRLIGYENRDIADRDFRNDRVDAGEIGAGHRVTALYDVVLRDGYRGADLATVRMRNKKPGRDSAAVEWETRFPSDLLHDELADAGDDFRLAFGAATFAELLRGSPYVAEVSYSQVWELVDGAKRRGEETHTELLSLIETAGRLSGEESRTVAWR